MNDGKRVLVIDDEEATRRLFTDALAMAGYFVETADNGAQALGGFDLPSYAVIISDINMPKLDGAGLYEQAVGR